MSGDNKINAIGWLRLFPNPKGNAKKVKGPQIIKVANLARERVLWCDFIYGSDPENSWHDEQFLGFRKIVLHVSHRSARQGVGGRP